MLNARRPRRKTRKTRTAAPAGVELVSLDEVEASEEKAAEPVGRRHRRRGRGRAGRCVPRGGRGGRGRRHQPDRRRYRSGRGAVRAIGPAARRRTGGKTPAKKFRSIGSCGARAFASIQPPRRNDAVSSQWGAREAAGEFGAIAQLGERFNGIEEVVGSIPSGSTNHSRSFCIFAARTKEYMISVT